MLGSQGLREMHPTRHRLSSGQRLEERTLDPRFLRGSLPSTQSLASERLDLLPRQRKRLAPASLPCPSKAAPWRWTAPNPTQGSSCRVQRVRKGPPEILLGRGP